MMDVRGQLAIDVNALAQTRAQARQDPQAALKDAARQFEAVFLQMVLKSMRDATPQDGLFDNEQSRLFQSMLDQQLAQTLSASGTTGLARLIEQQLGRGLAAGAPAAGAAPTGVLPAAPTRLPQPAAAPALPFAATPAADSPPAGRVAGAGTPAREFVDRLWSHASEASRTTGIPAHFMIAQAALETGWGRAELRHADGSPTHNLFGIKAGRNWQGAVAEATTTEYVNGVEQKKVERFRAYSSYAEAFRDYASLLGTSPRYAAVLNAQDAAGFARGLQQAGYATDPMYAAKLERIIGGATLRNGLADSGTG